MVSTEYKMTFGAGANPTGNPIGGGDGYKDILTPTQPGAGNIVTTAGELFDALRDAESGDVIYIDETARINLTGAPAGVVIPPGVTLAGNRGERSVTGSATYAFEIKEPGDYAFRVRASGLNGGGGTIRVSVDDEEIRRWDLDEVGQDWHWSTGEVRYLSGGKHTLSIYWREDDPSLDAVLITGDIGYLPDTAAGGQSGRDNIHIEAESGDLSQGLEKIADPAASNGAYVSAHRNSTARGEYPVSPGGLIYLRAADSDPRIGFIAGGENVRITGIRLEGPDTGNETDVPSALGIHSAYRNLEVDNCEIWGWNGAAIGIAGTGGSDMKAGGYIHHNYIHHCQMEGLGYGVVVSGGATSLIEANYFDYCRHAIAGSGVAGDGYEARYNICGPNFIVSSSHNFDMHGVVTGSTTIAGDTIKIHHNTFMATGPLSSFPVAIRGVPRDGAYIDHNWFYYTQAPPVWQTGGQERVFVTENLIGQNGIFSESGPISYY